jgi:hypothetical protein
MNESIEDSFIIWEAPKIIPPEFRLYYDDQGKVITYTCEKIEGNYVVIDSITFAQARPDIRIVNGKLSTINSSLVVTRLTPNTTEGVKCAKEDISIIVPNDYTGETIKWKLNIYELG